MLLSMAQRQPSTLRDLIDEPRMRRAIADFRGKTLTIFDASRYRGREGDFVGVGCAK